MSSSPTTYKTGDRVQVIWAIGKTDHIGPQLDQANLPPIFPEGSLGEILSDFGGKLEVVLEHKDTKQVGVLLLPVASRGKLQLFDHGKSWGRP